MTDQEKILKIMEEAKSPLKARAIAKLIYQNFDGYRLPGWAVRKILWDKNQLRDLIKYDNENYTYSLQKDIETIKKVVTNDDFAFSVKIEKFNRVRNDNNIINYKIKGDQITIKHCLLENNLDDIIIGLIRSEIEQSLDKKVNFKKIKANISKALDGRK